MLSAVCDLSFQRAFSPMYRLLVTDVKKREVKDLNEDRDTTNSSTLQVTPGYKAKSYAAALAAPAPSELARSPQKVGSHAEDGQTIRVFSGNPKVDIITGSVKLFRRTDKDSSPLGLIPEGASNVLVVLGVPSAFSPLDFLSFASPEVLQASVRILRCSERELSDYMVLLTFKAQSAAEDFYLRYDGRHYNQFDALAGVCRVLWVEDAELPASTMDIPHAPSNVADVPMAELPTCPVCLERLDSSVSGLLQMACNHLFHNNCISEWGQNKCPVCRYSLASFHQGGLDDITASTGMIEGQTDDDVEETACSVCDTSSGLWICMVCGVVGCGRYEGAHARAHFESSRHTYSMELETGRVWDYTGDGYVHRLVQNMNDGKVMELPGTGSSGKASGLEPEGSESNESTVLQYQHLLRSQIESQRLFFEKELQAVEDNLQAALAQVATLRASNAALERRASRAENITAKWDDVVRERDMYFELNKALMANQETLKQQVSQRDLMLRQSKMDNADLKDELRDLYIYIETSKLIAQEGDSSLQGGTAVVAPKPARRSNLSRRGGGGG